MVAERALVATLRTMALDSQMAVVERDRDLGVAHPRQLNANDQASVGLVDIGRRAPDFAVLGDHNHLALEGALQLLLQTALVVSGQRAAQIDNALHRVAPRGIGSISKLWGIIALVAEAGQNVRGGGGAVNRWRVSGDARRVSVAMSYVTRHTSHVTRCRPAGRLSRWP